MNFKRAVGLGALLWVLIFFEVSVLMFGFGLTGTESVFRIAHYIILAVLAVIVALLYFKKSKKGFNKGLMAGVVFALTGLVLDAAITVPLFIKDWMFFTDSFLWIGVIEVVAISAIVGMMKK